MSTFADECSAWLMASGRRVVLHRINDQGVERLDAAVAAALGLAKGSGDRDALEFLWELRWKIAQTLLPFDHDSLGLGAAFDRLTGLPSLKANPELVRILSQTLSSLINQPQNPKSVVLLDVYCEADCPSVLLWSRPRDSSSPGFPAGSEGYLAQLLDEGKLQILRGRRDLPERCECLVLGSPLHRDFPEAAAKQLLSQVRWSEIHVLSYALPLEALESTKALLAPPQGLSYWVGERVVDERTHGSPEAPTREVQAGIIDPSDLVDRDLERWTPGIGWGEGDGGTVEPVEAVAIRLRGDLIVAYATGSFVRVLNRAGRPEVPIAELEPGDLIAVLTAGDAGQTLEDITEERFGGAQALGEHRRNCLSWKRTVATCLGSVGSEELRKKFFALVGNPHAPWNDDAWSTDRLLAPKRPESFRALIRAVHHFGFFLDLRGEDQLDGCIAEWWQGIQSIRGIRRAAGRKINLELSRHLDEFIARQPTDGLFVGQEIALDAINRSYRICEVVAVSDPLLAHPANLERLKTWQQ